MGEYCECFHSKHASMVSNLLVDIMMWYNMLHECHCAIGQTPSWYKRGTATIHNRDMLIKHCQGVMKDLLTISNVYIYIFYVHWFVILVSMTLYYIYTSVLDHMCMCYVSDIMYHHFFICPKGCINYNTTFVPMFNHHLPLSWCLDTQNERHVLSNEITIHLYPNFLIVKHWIGVLFNPHLHTFYIVLM